MSRAHCRKLLLVDYYNMQYNIKKSAAANFRNSEYQNGNGAMHTVLVQLYTVPTVILGVQKIISNLKSLRSSHNILSSLPSAHHHCCSAQHHEHDEHTWSTHHCGTTQARLRPSCCDSGLFDAHQNQHLRTIANSLSIWYLDYSSSISTFRH